MLSWRHAVSPLKVLRKVSLVAHTDAGHYLLDIEKGGFHQFFCLSHSERFEVLRGSRARFFLEEVTKPGGREIHRLRHHFE